MAAVRQGATGDGDSMRLGQVKQLSGGEDSAALAAAAPRQVCALGEGHIEEHLACVLVNPCASSLLASHVQGNLKNQSTLLDVLLEPTGIQSLHCKKDMALGESSGFRQTENNSSGYRLPCSINPTD